MSSIEFVRDRDGVNKFARPWLLGALLPFIILISGCASVPNLNSTVDAVNGSPTIVGARGALTQKQSKSIIAKLEAEGRDSDVLERHLALEGALSESPIVVGNKVTVLKTGQETFGAIFEAIKAAKHHVNLEYYIIEDIENQGRHLGELLAEKRRAGVQVNVIYDGFGSAGTPASFLETLIANGVNLVAFNSSNLLSQKHGPNNRDHRKILVVDGAIAITGGVNLSSVYSSTPFRKEGKEDQTAAPAWKDSAIKIEGPAVAQFQGLFLATWKDQNGPPLDEADFFPKPEIKGSETIHVIGGEPSDAVPIYYASLLSAIRNADSRIWISAAYFVPTHQEREDLTSAAHRGIDVKLLLPGITDSSIALNAGRSRYTSLLRSGVEIYEAQKQVLHSKSAVIDGVWTALGSSNFDHRSVLYNQEVDVIVLGRETAGELEENFRNDILAAKPITLSEWKRRPLTRRMKEFFSRIWQNLL